MVPEAYCAQLRCEAPVERSMCSRAKKLSESTVDNLLLHLTLQSHASADHTFAALRQILARRQTSACTLGVVPMVKKRKRSALPSRKEQAPSRADNPFEQLYQNKKFDVLGKRSKGDSRKLVKSRADAVDKASSCFPNRSSVLKWAGLVDLTAYVVVNALLVEFLMCHTEK